MAKPDPLELLDEVHARFGTRGLARIEQVLRDRAAGTTPEPEEKLQRSGLLYIPGLDVRPFHDRARFPWADAFEAATGQVRAEFERLERDGVADDDSFEGYGERWRGWLLYQHGRWLEPVASRCPTAVELIRSTHHTLGEFLFSEVGPGGEIPWHSGGCNAVLSAHLPLIVPDGCRIGVGVARRSWSVGEILVFDDSFVHAVWNDSDQRRIVLVWEVWHPDLDGVERQAVDYVYRRLVNEGICA